MKPLSNEEEFRNWYSNFIANSQIILILGKRRSGKTALGLKLLELKLKSTKLKAYSYKYPVDLPEVEKITDIKAVRPDSILFIDEIGIWFPSKRHMKKKHLTLGELLYLAGQKNITLIGTVQNSLTTDINVIRNIDTLIVKELSLMQIRTERKFIVDILENAKDALEFFPPTERNKFAYIYSDQFRGLVQFSLPSFWSEKYSFPYKVMKL